MSQHAILAPSSAGEWVHCARSLDRPDAILNGSSGSEESEEGTLAHGVLAAGILGLEIPEGATDEMTTFAREMRDAVGSRFPEASTSPRRAFAPLLLVEDKVHAPSIHPECWGTPDVVVIDAANKRVVIWDYKYGHKFVEVVRNWQIVCYWTGVRDMFGLTDDYTFEAFIFQPRCYHHDGGPLRRWEVSGLELKMLAQVASFAAHAVFDPEAPATTGDHCEYCKRRTTCEALLMATNKAIDVSMATGNREPTAEEIGQRLQDIDDAEARLKALRTGLEVLALHKLKSGEQIPGWSVGFTNPHSRWKVSDDSIIQVAALFGVDISVAKPCTPSQAIQKGLDKTVAAHYSHRPSGAPKLVRMTHGGTHRKLKG